MFKSLHTAVNDNHPVFNALTLTVHLLKKITTDVSDYVTHANKGGLLDPKV